MKTELLNRTKNFALEIIKLVNDLPQNSVNKVIGAQILRSATSIGANYRAALRAKSRPDFIYKIKIVEEESDETIYWLELLKESNINFIQIIEKLLCEAKELTAIFSKIAITTKQRSKKA